jgi:hypothetical protein
LGGVGIIYLYILAQNIPNETSLYSHLLVSRETCIAYAQFCPYSTSMADDFYTDFTKRFPSALCAQTDPEIFFPEKGGSTVAAKKVCMRCPERVDCLEDVLQTRERFGIRGGLSPRERDKIIKVRERAQVKK